MNGSTTAQTVHTGAGRPFPGCRGPVHSAWRTAGPAALAQAMQATRARTLGLMRAWQNALPDLSVPPQTDMNPPLWEWGHIAWFQEWWTVRNPQRHSGTRIASSGEGFALSLLAGADALYNSSEVAHDSRWALPLPDLTGTEAYLAQVLQHSLAHLQVLQEDLDGVSDQALYFWRLVLQHEDMHNEASVYMAQALGLPLPEGLCRRSEVLGHAGDQEVNTNGGSSIMVPAQVHALGHSGAGFAFDNERMAHPVTLEAFDIDAAAVTWARYLPFVQATGHAEPPHLRCERGVWQVQTFGQWQALDLQAPAVHLNAHDAQAWCRWANRRLPTEAEWECAAQHPDLAWGQVWEWTVSDFLPYPGFEVHPYRDYSAPWWSRHRVLRGASAATSAHVVDERYRNFFVPERRDIFAGFRSVAL